MLKSRKEDRVKIDLSLSNSVVFDKGTLLNSRLRTSQGLRVNQNLQAVTEPNTKEQSFLDSKRNSRQKLYDVKDKIKGDFMKQIKTLQKQTAKLEAEKRSLEEFKTIYGYFGNSKNTNEGLRSVSVLKGSQDLKKRELGNEAKANYGLNRNQSEVQFAFAPRSISLIRNASANQIGESQDVRLKEKNR